MLGDAVGISAVVAAMMGLSVLLLTGVLTWKDCLTYPPAWDTLFWFAVLVGALVLSLYLLTRNRARYTRLLFFSLARAHSMGGEIPPSLGCHG